MEPAPPRASARVVGVGGAPTLASAALLLASAGGAAGRRSRSPSPRAAEADAAEADAAEAEAPLSSPSATSTLVAQPQARGSSSSRTARPTSRCATAGRPRARLCAPARGGHGRRGRAATTRAHAARPIDAFTLIDTNASAGARARSSGPRRASTSSPSRSATRPARATRAANFTLMCKYAARAAPADGGRPRAAPRGDGGGAPLPRARRAALRPALPQLRGDDGEAPTAAAARLHADHGSDVFLTAHAAFNLEFEQSPQAIAAELSSQSPRARAPAREFAARAFFTNARARPPPPPQLLGLHARRRSLRGLGAPLARLLVRVLRLRQRQRAGRGARRRDGRSRARRRARGAPGRERWPE